MKYIFTIPRTIVFTLIMMGMLMGVGVKVGWGQTNPTAQTLPQNQSFGTSSFSQLPAGFAAWNGAGGIGTLANAESSIVNGDASVSAATSTTTTAGAYGLSIAGNARVYIQTSSNTTNGRNQLALAINTIGKESIKLSFQSSVELVADAGRVYGVVAQYRVGTSGDWTTLTGGSVQYTNELAGTTTVFTNLSLGPDANNQAVVQIRWATWRSNSGSGSSGGLSIDNITVSGENLITPVLGVLPTELTDYKYEFGSGPSESKSFELSGSNLDGSDVVVTAPANFEVSDSEMGAYTSTLTLAAFDGSDTDIWVRMAAGLATGDYSGNVVVTGGGATAVNVAVDGNVDPIYDHVEPFDNFPVTTSTYSSGSFVGAIGNTWNYVDANRAKTIDGQTVLLRNNTSSSLNTVLDYGLTNFSFDYMQAFATNVNLDVFINGSKVATVATSGEQDIVKNSGNIPVTGVSGTYTLEFKQGSGGGQVAIDNFSWTIKPPAIANPIPTPSSGLYFSDQTVFVSNYDSYDSTVTIYYTTDGSEPDGGSNEYDHVTGILINDGFGDVVLKMIALDDADASYIVNTLYQFPENVPNIAALRAGETDGTPYRLTGEAVVTFLTSNRNAKYIQDATGAILIDDPINVVTSTYDLYDGIENFVGTLGFHRSMLQFRPLLDPGDPSSKGNTITPTLVTLNDLDHSYQAKLVRINNLTIDDAGQFVASTNYDLSSPSGTGIMRTAYTDLDYIGHDIPSVPQNLIGVVLQFDEILQLVPRSSGDFEDYLAPTLVRNPTSLTGFKYIEGHGPSPPKSFVLTGLHLEPSVGTITVTGSVDFEVSADNATFGESATFDYTGSTLTATDIFVRLKSGLSIGDYTNQLVIASGGGATQVAVNVNGEVIEVPPGLPYAQDFSGFSSQATLPIEFVVDASGSAPNKLDFSPWANGGNNNTGVKHSTTNASVLGYQHISTTGKFSTILTLMNNTGSVVEDLKVSYLGKVARSTEGRSPEWTVKVNGAEVAALAYSTEDGIDKLVSTTLTGLNIPPSSIITIEWSSERGDPSGSSKQIGISNVIVKLIDNPVFSLAEDTYYEEQTVFVSNYNDFSSDVEIRYTTDGSTPDGGSYLYNDLNGIVLGEGLGGITLKAIAIDTEKGFESFVVQANYNMGSIIPVANIGELRNMFSAKSGPVAYEIAGEVVLTLQGDYRNHKYIQDATGAILIDDAAGIITTAYELGDGITGITGELSIFADMFQFVPIADPGPRTSFNNVIIPEVRTLSSLSSTDQAMLVKILSLSFSATGNFAGTTDYVITDPEPGTGVLRTHYSDLDYVDPLNPTPIPGSPKHITGVILQFNNVLQLIPRDLTDFSNPVIAAINPAGVVGVPFGTSEADALALMPTTTTILDDGGAPYVVTLTWTHIENYDQEKMGNYQAFATFDLPEGLDQSDPETDLIAQGTVAVSAPIPLTRWGIYLSMVAMALSAGYFVRRNMF